MTITYPAKCKDCKFSEMYNPRKNNGELSRKRKTKCKNPESIRAFQDIRQTDLVCDKWKLI